MRRLPPLNALPAFEATARLGSMVLAAQELGRTHGAISKQIRTLTDAVGHELFEREGTGLKLTADGAQFRDDVAAALDQIAGAYATLRRRAPDKALLLGISATFASRWLMPRLPRFHARHPEISVDFHMAGRGPYHIGDADLFISWDRLRHRPDVDDWYEPIGDVAYALVHAPSLSLPSASDALHVPTRLVPDTLPDIWEVWAPLSGLRVTADRDYVIPQTGLIIDSAANGAGVALLEKRLIEEELRDARLVAPFGFHIVENGLGVFLPTATRDKTSVKAFVDWLKTVA